MVEAMQDMEEDQEQVEEAAVARVKEVVAMAAVVATVQHTVGEETVQVATGRVGVGLQAAVNRAVVGLPEMEGVGQAEATAPLWEDMEVELGEGDAE